jgi:hypothetical protein
MDHVSTSEEKPQEKPHEEHTPFRKSKFYLWLTSSSELIGIFIAVAIVVAGSIIVFGNNATQREKNKQAVQKQQPKKEKMTTKNVTTHLSANIKKLQKRVNRANRTLKSTGKSGAAKESRTFGASVAGTAVTADAVELQADRRITELWQAQNAVEANADLPQSLQSQIVRKIGSKMGRLDSLKKGISEDATPSELTDLSKKLQEQKVYTCYLPNITRQTVNEDFAALTKEQNSFTKELQGVASEFKKQGKKTTDLNGLIAKRNRQVKDINSNVQTLRQNGIQAENSNCATPSPYSITPLTKEFADLSTLDEQIRRMVDQMLKEKGVVKNPATTSAPKSKNQGKKLAREIKKKAKGKQGKNNKAPKPTEIPAEAEPTATETEPEPTTTEEEVELTPTEAEESEDPKTTPETTPKVTPDEEEPSGEPLEKPDYAALGLPQPQTDAVNDLKAQIEDEEKATWAVNALLAAEKTAIEKDIDVIPYLTTAWVWYENGSAAWPDPYEINCNDNREGYFSEVSIICKDTNFQVGGYQAAAQKSQYVSLFTKLYDPEGLTNVIKRVASESTNAIRPQWNYNDQGQQKGVLKQYITQLSSVKIGDISPNVDFFSEKGQFFTLLAGKDPNMVIALNSFAVSTDDLVAALKSGSCGYGYICAEDKQLLSNMVTALYLIDGGTL